MKHLLRHVALISLAALLWGVPSAAAHPRAAVHGVNVADSLFDPETITVQVGDTVAWDNTGAIPHTVTANDGSFNSGNLSPGASFSYTFSQPGTFEYYCKYHAVKGSGVGMIGHVVVEGPPQPAAPPEPSPEPQPTAAPKPKATAVPATATVTATPEPTETPIEAPTASASPTEAPTASPTLMPSRTPTAAAARTVPATAVPPPTETQPAPVVSSTAGGSMLPIVGLVVVALAAVGMWRWRGRA